MYEDTRVCIEEEVAHVGRGRGPSWRDAHQQLQRIAKGRAALDADEAKWLLVARETGAHRELGYGSFTEYLERQLGYAPRTARERIRVAERLAALPQLRAALARGETTYSAVRELTRIAEPENEADLIAQAKGKTVREIEDLVAGDAPRTRTLTMELPPQVYAQFLEAKRMLQVQAGSSLDDAAVVSAMCQAVLERGAGGTGPRHQLAVNVCARCDRGSVDAAGQIIDLEPTELALARCDAAHVSRDGAVTVDIPRKIRRAVETRDHHRCRVPGCRASMGLHLHHLDERARGGAHTPENLILLCAAHHDAHHAGKLRIIGASAERITFEHADRRPYGEHDPLAVAQATLRQLGYSPKEAARAADEVRRALGPDDRPDLEQLLRACLRACPIPRSTFS
jgi:hypothetical protein